MIVLPPNRYVQLGNKLILFAHFIAYHLESGQKLANPGFAPYAHLFPYFDGDAWNRVPNKSSALTASKGMRKLLYDINFWWVHLLNKMGSSHAMDIGWEKKIDFNDAEFVKKSQKSPLYLQGWLYRDHDLVMKHRAAILPYFTPGAQLLSEMKSSLDKIRGTKKLVGVHIRRGDYKNFEDGKYYYDLSVYKEQMKKVSTLLEGEICFLICSDEKIDLTEFADSADSAESADLTDPADLIESAESADLTDTAAEPRSEGTTETSATVDLTVHPGPGSLIGDLYSLSMCDQIIGPPSTFSYWASWYGNVPYLELKEADMSFQLDDFKVKVI